MEVVDKVPFRFLVSCHKERMTTLPDPARFAHVTDWVFDLDNTLYPHHTNLSRRST